MFVNPDGRTYIWMACFSGNEVDQLFSILTTEFKGSDINDVESLKDKIKNAPMKPKPIVESMMFSWDWKEFIEPKLNSLENHSYFNSFRLNKELGEVKLRYKKLPQSPEYGPICGIQLLKVVGGLHPIKASEFRIESLNLDKLLRGLQPFFATFDLETRMQVVSRWEALKKTLEALPVKRDSLPRMDLMKFPKQAQVRSSIVEVEENYREVQGTFCKSVVEEGDLEKDLCTGMDVCVYTSMKQKRPWVGRVTKVKGKQSFEINWYQKDKASKCGKYDSMTHDDGSVYVSELNVSSVMFWAFTERREATSFIITPYWQDCLMKEYGKIDRND